MCIDGVVKVVFDFLPVGIHSTVIWSTMQKVVGEISGFFSHHIKVCFLEVVDLSRRLRLELRLHIDVKQNQVMVRNTRKNINVADELRAASDYKIQDTVGLRSCYLVLKLCQWIFMKKTKKSAMDWRSTSLYCLPGGPINVRIVKIPCNDEVWLSFPVFVYNFWNRRCKLL